MSDVITVTEPADAGTITITKTRSTSTVTDPTADVVTVASPGLPGQPNTLAIGTVVHGDAAAATITGTAPTQTLNLTLPKGGTYKHTQGVAATSWTIAHNLGFEPGGVAVVDSAGTEVIGTITYSSLNEIVVSFTTAFAGKAYVS